MSWTSVIVCYVDVLDEDGRVTIGNGLTYWDGKQLLRPDIIALNGEILPPGLYNLYSKGEPVLAVMSNTVQ